MNYVTEKTDLRLGPTLPTSLRAMDVPDVDSPAREATASLLDRPLQSPGITPKIPSYSEMREGVIQVEREERIILHKTIKSGFTVVSSIPKDTPEERERKNNDMIIRALELLKSTEDTALF